MRSSVLSFIGWLIITFLNKLIRVNEVNHPDLKNNENILYAFWHGEQLLPFYQRRNEKIVVMSSLSKDGEIQTGILKRLGYTPVRGSSSRGAGRALVETIRLVKGGLSAAFAVDGPRGPLYDIKPGILYLAQKTGKSIYPAGSNARRNKVLAKAWDKYEIPMPLTSAVVTYGKPIRINKDDNIERKASELKESLLKVSDFSHKYFWSDNIEEYLTHHPNPKILIIQLSRIGDVVFSLPTLSAIRKKYPHAKISWLVDERCESVLSGHKYIDEIIVFNRKRVSISYLLKFRKLLRNKKYDLSIDLHGLFKSAFLAWFTKARFRIGSASTNGMKELSSFFSREIKPEKPETHCVVRHLEVAKYLGCDTNNLEYNIDVSSEDKKSLENILREKDVDLNKKLTVMFAGGGWIARRWHKERFSELCNKLVKDTKTEVILIGGKEGGAKEQGVNEYIQSNAQAKVHDFTNKLTLKELAALLLRTSLFVGNEAGPMHMAVALNTPVVALIGPTNPDRTGPYRGNTRIIRHKIECAPCRNRNCKSKKCMDMITVDEVYNVCKQVISS